MVYDPRYVPLNIPPEGLGGLENQLAGAATNAWNTDPNGADAAWGELQDSILKGQQAALLSEQLHQQQQRTEAGPQIIGGIVPYPYETYDEYQTRVKGLQAGQAAGENALQLEKTKQAGEGQKAYYEAIKPQKITQKDKSEALAVPTVDKKAYGIGDQQAPAQIPSAPMPQEQPAPSAFGWIDNYRAQGKSPEEISNIIAAMPGKSPLEIGRKVEAMRYLVNLSRSDATAAQQTAQAAQAALQNPSALQAQAQQPAAPAPSKPVDPEQLKFKVNQIVSDLKAKGASDAQIKQYAEAHPAIKSLILAALGGKNG